MKKILLGMVLFGLSIGAANAVVDVPMHEVTDFGANSYSFTYKHGNSLSTETMEYNGPVSGLAVGNDFSNQSFGNVGTIMENAFFPSTTRTFDFVSQVNQDNTGSLGGGSVSTSHGYTTFSSASSFEYLAVHFGGAEAFFHFATPINSFRIKSDDAGLSNYRAYNVSPVPEADEFAMMVLGIGMIGFVARRK